ncbi:MAG TPA: RNA 2',3'-cyclic phosphodiesterase [Streptosporangiaceae bacterium]
MRLFVAIVPPPAVTAELDGQLAGPRADWPALRWTRQPDWHVTLAFLGEVPEPVLPPLITRLERAARRHQPQELAVHGVGTFPGVARAQVLWAGIRAAQAPWADSAPGGQTGQPPRAALGPPGRVGGGSAGQAGGLASLSALAASVAAGARRAGAPPPDASRRYRPHITLARLSRPADLRALAAALSGLTSLGWTAADIELIRSHPPAPIAGARPTYETLARCPLG